MKIGIMAPSNVHCGISRAGEVVLDLLENYEVTILDLKRNVLIHNGNSSDVKDVLKYVDQLIETAKECDLIIWQHEPGTLGRNWRQQRSIHKALCKIPVPKIIELHTVVDFKSTFLPKLFTQVFYRSFRQSNIRKAFVAAIRESTRLWFWKNIFREVANATSNDGAIIVHRDKDLAILRNFCRSVANVHVEELDSLTNSMWNFAKNSSAYFKVTELSRIDGLFSSLQNEQIIVQPGFISRYKGHLTSLEAMRVLPDNVHLVILGEIHEVQADSSPDPASMTTSLVETLNQMPLSIKSRIHFISNPSDLEIAASIHSSDAVLLPYIDTGQSGSGPFSESLSLGAQILCSNIPAFRTERSSNPNIHYFDVGNIYQIRDELEMMYRRRELSLINGRRNVSYPWKAPRQLPNYKFFLRDLVEKCLSQQV